MTGEIVLVSVSFVLVWMGAATTATIRKHRKAFRDQFHSIFHIKYKKNGYKDDDTCQKIHNILLQLARQSEKGSYREREPARAAYQRAENIASLAGFHNQVNKVWRQMIEETRRK